MDFAQIATLLGQFGPLGIFIAYLVWRENRNAEASALREDKDRALARERIEADKDMARALDKLAFRIEGLKP